MTVQKSGGEWQGGHGRGLVGGVGVAGRIAEGDEPVSGCVGHAAEVERAGTGMRTASEGAVVVPDDEEGEEARREGAVNGEMRAQDAVPILDGTAGTDGRLPGLDEHASGGLPGWGQLGDEVIPAWSEDGTALPPPGHQRDAVWTEDDGGILLDVSHLQDVEIDRKAMRARVGPGCRGNELLAMLLDRDLFFPAGHCPGVALGGYLLQGGFGWNGRVHGPACMSVEAIDAVTADGDLVHASETENADLLWAARGAGPGLAAGGPGSPPALAEPPSGPAYARYS